MPNANVVRFDLDEFNDSIPLQNLLVRLQRACGLIINPQERSLTVNELNNLAVMPRNSVQIMRSDSHTYQIRKEVTSSNETFIAIYFYGGGRSPLSDGSEELNDVFRSIKLELGHDPCTFTRVINAFVYGFLQYRLNESSIKETCLE